MCRENRAAVDMPKVGDYDDATMKEWLVALRKSFFAGLLVVVPVAASVLILLGLFTWFTDFLLPESLRQRFLTPLYRVIVAVLFVVFTAFVGWITRMVAGRQLVAITESVIKHVPLLNKTYGFMKDVSQTVLSGKKTMFHRVVLVEFPRPGVYSIGFVTGVTEGEAQEKTKDAVINVFVPTTPNPTSGFLLLVPQQQLIDLDMTVAEGLKMVISCGTVVPPYPTGTQQPPGPL